MSARALRDYVAHARSAATAHVVLLCGMTGSGKTTLAAELEQALPGIRFSIDAWMVELFGQHMPRTLFDERHHVIEELLWRTVERLVALRVHVVLDYGFWRADERAAAARRVVAAGGEPVLIYLDVPIEALALRLERRNARLPPGTFEVTREMLDLFAAQFEPPSPDEALTIIAIQTDAGLTAEG